MVKYDRKCGFSVGDMINIDKLYVDSTGFDEDFSDLMRIVHGDFMGPQWRCMGIKWEYDE